MYIVYLGGTPYEGKTCVWVCECVCVREFESACVSVWCVSAEMHSSPRARRKKHHCTKAWATWTSMHHTANQCENLRQNRRKVGQIE